MGKNSKRSTPKSYEKPFQKSGCCYYTVLYLECHYSSCWCNGQVSQDFCPYSAFNPYKAGHKYRLYIDGQIYVDKNRCSFPSYIFSLPLSLMNYPNLIKMIHSCDETDEKCFPSCFTACPPNAYERW